MTGQYRNNNRSYIKYGPLFNWQASSFLEKTMFLKSYLNHIHSFFALLSSSVSRANLSGVVATIFSSPSFLSSSFYMANRSRLVAASLHLCLLPSPGHPELYVSDHLLQS